MTQGRVLEVVLYSVLLDKNWFSSRVVAVTTSLNAFLKSRSNDDKQKKMGAAFALLLFGTTEKMCYRIDM